MRRAGGVIVLALAQVPTAARPTNGAEPVPMIVAPAASPALEALPRMFPGRISIYQRNYFIAG
jgi:hypothetical protein